jgi:hypothetical protein
MHELAIISFSTDSSEPEATQGTIKIMAEASRVGYDQPDVLLDHH